MARTADCGVTMIQSILLSGEVFNKSVFGEIVCEISFFKVDEDNYQ